MKFVENMKNLFEAVVLDTASEEIKAFRKNVFNRFVQLGLPTHKNEEWKYTNLSFLNDIDFVASNVSIDAKGSNLLLESNHLVSSLLDESIFFPIVNGNLIIDKSNFEVGSNLFEVRKTFGNGTFSKFLKHFNLFYDDTNPFAFLNLAFSSDGISIHIPQNVAIEKPIVLLYDYNNSQPSVSNSLTFIEVGDNSSVKIILLFSKGTGEVILGNEMVNILQKNGSEVEVNIVQYDLSNLKLINNLNVMLESNSIFKGNSFSLNTEFVRNNLNIAFQGPYSSANLNGIYYCDTNNFVDDHTLIMHNVPNCQSDENFRGILDGKGRAVFNGKIFVARDAQKTNAYQSNKNLILSDEARINTKPQLEIYADDVKCTHGATAGFLDKEMLFYIISRGIGKEKAKSLLLNSFVSGNLEKIEIASLRDYLKEIIAKKLHLEDIFFCSALDMELIKTSE